jgi:hypothetical protein
MISSLLLALKSGSAVSFGTGTLSWSTGALTSASDVLITHGLGRTPKCVLATIRFSGSDPDNLPAIIVAFNYTATTFSARGRRSAAVPAPYTSTFDWIAVG